MTGRRRAKAQVQARYDAGGMGRRARAWTPPSTGPRGALQGFERIRNRARDAGRNDWAAKSARQKWTTTLIGTGIEPRWDHEGITSLWNEFAAQADAGGLLHYYALQVVGTNTLVESGEYFIRRRPRPSWMPLAVPLQLELLEGDYVPMLDADERTGMPKGNYIRQGVEFDRFGARAAYWVYKEHPGDNPRAIGPDDLIRVLAKDMAHVFTPKRIGDIRGVSDMAEVLMRLRAMGDFEDAVLDRQKLANLFTAFITRQVPESWDGALNEDGLPAYYDSEGALAVGLEPGLTQELKPGEDVKFANPPGTDTAFAEYVRMTNLGTAAGAGLPYELHTGDIANVSDRVLRVILVEFRRLAQQRQWTTLIPQGCQRVVEWFADAAVLSGKLPLTLLPTIKKPKHVPQRFEYIHPVQDVEAKIKEIDAGLTSLDRARWERGDDPAEIDRERKAAQDRQDKLGIRPPEPPPGPGAPAGGPTPGAKPAVKASMDAGGVDLGPVVALVAQMAQNMQTMMGQFAQVAQALASRQESVVVQANMPAQAAPVVHVAGAVVHVPEAPAPVVNVAAPEVTVQAPVVNVPEAPAPVVHVAAPAVTVENNVNPTVTVDLPPRETVSDITRDSKGDIVKVKQTERTLQ